MIATKVGLDWGSGKILRNSSPARLRSELEDSLRRLKTDVIDIYQVHWPDEAIPFEETAKVLDSLRREGKIRAIGVSNFSPEQMGRFRKWAPLATIQPPYNLFEREIEKDVLPYAEKHGLVVLAYGALCRGPGRVCRSRCWRVCWTWRSASRPVDPVGWVAAGRGFAVDEVRRGVQVSHGRPPARQVADPRAGPFSHGPQHDAPRRRVHARTLP
ncbi:MAG: aldo/keto reductase [Burkholderiaceae bacterium]